MTKTETVLEARAFYGAKWPRTCRQIRSVIDKESDRTGESMMAAALRMADAAAEQYSFAIIAAAAEDLEKLPE